MQMKKNIKAAIIVLYSMLLFTSCNSPKHNDINIELSGLTKELVTSFAENKTIDSCKDHTCTYIIRCYGDELKLFYYKDFSHKDFVGRAMADNKLVKVYGEHSSIFYREQHKTKEKEKYDTNGDYVEDLEWWSVNITDDTIRLQISDYDARKVITIRDICRTHFPDAVIFWQRNSFRLDDILL